MKKVCSRCKKDKDTSEFNKNKNEKFGVGHYCRKCQNDSQKKWRRKNPKEYNEIQRRYQAKWRKANPKKWKKAQKRHIATNKQRRSDIKQELVDYKGGKCMSCGYDKCLKALDFHHIDPSTKSFRISNRLHRSCADVNVLKVEVDKCLLLCKNCHTELHDK